MRKNKKTKHFKNYLWIAILIVLLCICVFCYFYHKNQFKQTLKTIEDNQEQITKESFTSEEKKKEHNNTTITMTAIGDVMCHNTQYWDAYRVETDDYDFSYVFEDVAHDIEKADIAIGSLETSFAGKERGYSNYPTFNSPDNLAYSLKQIGIDVVSTAGNHCLDMGFLGLCRTIDVLEKAGISQLGTYQTQEDRDKILIKEIKGIKIAFINYTYGTNGISIPMGKEFCVNLIDKDSIQKDIESARLQNVDIIVACMHWGTEYRTTANAEQEELADFLFENGVDIILGNHPHVLEPMEKRTITLKDGTKKDGFVIYALGNFICDQNAENTRNSIILNLTITKHTDGKISMDQVNYVPIYMYKESSTKLRKMKLLDIEKTISHYETATDKAISEKTYQDLKIQLEKIKSIVGPEF